MWRGYWSRRGSGRTPRPLNIIRIYLFFQHWLRLLHPRFRVRMRPRISIFFSRFLPPSPSTFRIHLLSSPSTSHHQLTFSGCSCCVAMMRRHASIVLLSITCSEKFCEFENFESWSSAHFLSHSSFTISGHAYCLVTSSLTIMLCCYVMRVSKSKPCSLQIPPISGSAPCQAPPPFQIPPLFLTLGTIIGTPKWRAIISISLAM